jgi:hypothetical protein
MSRHLDNINNKLDSNKDKEDNLDKSQETKENVKLNHNIGENSNKEKRTIHDKLDSFKKKLPELVKKANTATTLGITLATAPFSAYKDMDRNMYSNSYDTQIVVEKDNKGTARYLEGEQKARKEKADKFTEELNKNKSKESSSGNGKIETLDEILDRFNLEIPKESSYDNSNKYMEKNNG